MSKNGRKRNITHTIAYCQECEWADENYITASRNGRRHAKKKKHSVHIEVAYYVVVDGKETP